MSEKKFTDEEINEIKEQCKKSSFIFNELHSAGLDFESSEKLAWGDLHKCNYYYGVELL